MDKELHWYAFRSYRNGKKLFLSRLKALKIESFVPELFHSLVFVRTTHTVIETLRSNLWNVAGAYLTPGTTKAAVIPDREMEIFRFVLATGCDTLEPCDVDFAKGDRVRITGGVFKDSEGYIVRIKGDRRFVVTIQGIAAVATTYIPKALMEKL